MLVLLSLPCIASCANSSPRGVGGGEFPRFFFRPPRLFAACLAASAAARSLDDLMCDTTVRVTSYSVRFQASGFRFQVSV